MIGSVSMADIVTIKRIRIILRLKSRVNDPPAEKNREEKTAAAVPPPPPIQRVERRNEASIPTASLPQQFVRKALSQHLDTLNHPIHSTILQNTF
ncbi:hypothetical protein TNCV_4912071 [Trichonephila clavipes]|nr:hypothetical protein TNCV_4912071 [Trichonephila clavipes]